MIEIPIWILPTSGVALILVNLLIWVFYLGKTRGSTSSRLNAVEERLDDPPVLPQCIEVFTEIKENLSHLNGTVETILRTMTSSNE